MGVEGGGMKEKEGCLEPIDTLRRVVIKRWRAIKGRYYPSIEREVKKKGGGG